MVQVGISVMITVHLKKSNLYYSCQTSLHSNKHNFISFNFAVGALRNSKGCLMRALRQYYFIITLLNHYHIIDQFIMPHLWQGKKCDRMYD